MATNRRSLALLACGMVLLSVVQPGVACIFKYGSSPDSLAAPKAGTHWSHAFDGADWDGVDGNGNAWACKTGKSQSPINIKKTALLDAQNKWVPNKLQTQWTFPDLVSDGSNIEVINTGHTIQVEWTHQYAADVTIAVPASPSERDTVLAVLGMSATDAVSRVHATPLQFHFHAGSEHWVDGVQYPLELHVVHRVTDLPGCAAGCFSVLGLMFKLVDGPDNPLLDAIWAAMPQREGLIAMLPEGATIELGKLLPPTSARNYVTYSGSLTTPPCSEGLLWHVLMQPQTISVRQLEQYRTAVGLKDCHAKGEESGEEAGKKRRAAAMHRRILAEAEGHHEEDRVDPDEYECKVVSLGTNARAPQPINSRVVKYARAP